MIKSKNKFINLFDLGFWVIIPIVVLLPLIIIAFKTGYIYCGVFLIGYFLGIELILAYLYFKKSKNVK